MSALDMHNTLPTRNHSFRVADRVKIKGSWHGKPAGTPGTVAYLEGENHVCVRLAEDWMKGLQWSLTVPACDVEIDPAYAPNRDAIQEYETQARAVLPDEFDAVSVALGISRESVQADMAKCFTLRDAAVVLDAPEYDGLARVFARAFNQASNGKGMERHGGAGVPFENQPMTVINAMLGSTDGFIYQAIKKSVESKRLPSQRAVAELLGAINYLAGAVLALERSQHA